MQAVLRSINLNAAKGRVGSQRRATELVRMAEHEEQRELEAVTLATFDYKSKWDAELARRRRDRINGPAPVIHPDNLVFDPEIGGITVREPLTKEEKAALGPWRERRNALEKELEELQARRSDRNCPNRHEVLEEIRSTEYVLRIIEDAFLGSRVALEVLETTIIPDEE
jgi:hypothetical protein